jgi:phosphate-selective porin OprO and OprP
MHLNRLVERLAHPRWVGVALCLYVPSALAQDVAPRTQPDALEPVVPSEQPPSEQAEPEPELEPPPAQPEPYNPEQDDPLGLPPDEAAPPNSGFSFDTNIPEAIDPAPVEAPSVMSDRPVAASTISFQPGKGLLIQSEDGEFSLRTRFWAQVLYGYRNNESELDDASQQLSLPRARTVFDGSFFGEHNHYFAQLGFSPVDADDPAQTTSSPVLDWYFDFDHLSDLSLRVGQHKVPHTRERLISGAELQLVDRSIVDAEFTFDRDVGAALHSQDLLGLDLLRYSLGIYSSRGRTHQPKENFGLMYVGRLELLPFGLFDDYSEADLQRNAEPRLSIGLSYARIQNAITNRGVLGAPPSDGGSTDINSYTADFMLKYSGLSLEGALAVRRARRDPQASTPGFEAGRDGLGWTIQAGYLLPEVDLEVVARAAQVRFRDVTGLPNQYEYGAGLNYYFSQHPLKLQLDYFRPGVQLFDVTGVDRGTDFSTQVRVQLTAAL